MEIIAIMSRKGGVGKTATAHALGAGLMKRGYRVLFVDLDGQANLSYALKATEDGNNSFHLLTHEAEAGEAIQQLEEGDIIPGNEILQTADKVIDDTGKEYRLKESLDPIRRKYDYIIIDTPAALGTVTINALVAANKVIIPLKADAYSMQGISRQMDIITAVKKYCNPKLKIEGFLITQYKGRANLPQQFSNAIEELAKKEKTKLFKTRIRDCMPINEAAAFRTNIFDYAPGSNGAKDYDAFINEFLGEDPKP